jgi:hypothetical protein
VRFALNDVVRASTFAVSALAAVTGGGAAVTVNVPFITSKCGEHA